MELKNLRIQNFKCILDSTDFSVNQLTCLVGKNESGKSAVLQALYKLNPIDEKDTYNPLYEYPKMYLTDYEAGDIVDGDNVVISTWEMNDDEYKRFEEDWGEGIIESNNITISSGYTNKREWIIPINFSVLFSHKMADCGFTQSENAHFQNIKTIGDVRTAIKAINATSESEQSFISWFNDNFPKNTISTFAENELLKFVPKFMYFSEYQKMPGKIAINDYIAKEKNGTLSENEKVFGALLSLANTSIEDIKDASKLEDLINKTEGVSSKITREIFEYWSQNKHLKVKFRCDMAKPGDEPPYNNGYVFSTRIENTRHNSTVSFDDRSAGFVWFFSFLIWFNKLKNETKNLFVLLDEPGLTLHAKAQSDLLRFFKERIMTKFQLMYTTHSPFMLDFTDILSARTVEDVTGEKDEVLGTKIGSKVLSKDKDTIFPLQAAFGYDITQTLFIGKNTLLVEGPSDILYIKFFSNILHEKKRISLSEDWTICPTGGIDKIQSFISLFSGNTLKVASLTDYHENDRTKINKLKSSGILDVGHILIASDYTDLATSDIEDIIGNEAYIKLVNKCYNLQDGNELVVPQNMDGKILSYVDKQMQPRENVSFNHYTPSVYLIEHPSIFKANEISSALDRFEKIFKDLNALL